MKSELERRLSETRRAAIVKRAERKPHRVYLGEGIWWTPSDSFWRSRSGRALATHPEKI